MATLKLNLSVSTLPVELDDNGTPQAYYLREMDAASRDKYLDTVSDRVRVTADGKPAGIKKFDGMQADLVSRCMFYGDGNNKDKPVSKEVIQKWPSSVVSQLYTEAQKLNHLIAKEKDEIEAEAKNV